MRTKSFKNLPLKPEVGQYIAMYSTLTARDFFLANLYPSGRFARIFCKTSLKFFSMLAALQWGAADAEIKVPSDVFTLSERDSGNNFRFLVRDWRVL